jgi:hypothetical protein
MWPFAKPNQECITLSLSDHDLAIGCFSPEHHKPPTLKAFERHSFETYSFLSIAPVIKSFMQKNKAHNAPLVISLKSPLIYEQLHSFSTMSPRIADVSGPDLKKLIWEYRYLLSADNGQHLFYLAGIARHAIVHYYLIAQKVGAQLVGISSDYMALIQAYRHMYGAAFRQSQLGVDLTRSEYNLEMVISDQTIGRLMTIPQSISIDTMQEKRTLLTFAGLYYQERE